MKVWHNLKNEIFRQKMTVITKSDSLKWKTTIMSNLGREHRYVLVCQYNLSDSSFLLHYLPWSSSLSSYILIVFSICVSHCVFCLHITFVWHICHRCQLSHLSDCHYSRQIWAIHIEICCVGSTTASCDNTAASAQPPNKMCWCTATAAHLRRHTTGLHAVFQQWHDACCGYDSSRK